MQQMPIAFHYVIVDNNWFYKFIYLVNDEMKCPSWLSLLLMVYVSKLFNIVAMYWFHVYILSY